MYEDFFGLREPPFHITPNPAYLYLSPQHEEALQHLRYGIASRKGFIVLTGEVGCGKTTLSRTLLNELESADCDTVLILNTRISEAQLIRLIIQDLGYRSEAQGKADLVTDLNAVLLEKIQHGRQIVVIIDEAQNLTFEVLEQLRLLSNLEADDQKLMQIVLLGQPELRERLRERRLRQFRQRVLVHYDLTPLRLPQTAAYIHHRLQRAGGRGAPLFTPFALRYLHWRSGGIPRLINHLADKSLLAAFVRDRPIVSLREVRRAWRETRDFI